MRWEDRGPSRNVEDRRGRGGVGVPLGIGGTAILLVLSLILGTDLFSLLGITPQVSGPSPAAPPVAESPAEEELFSFVSYVFDDTQSMWQQTFEGSDTPYQESTLVVYRQAVESGCGVAPSAVGPFYCPVDGNVYLDLSFYEALRQQLGAPGDFAQAYVIAHEMGHHVQNLLGIASDVRSAQSSNPELANRLSVAMELQADCLAGVWASTVEARGDLERGDVEEGLRAAAAVGDDRLVQGGGGATGIDEETFTHGTSEQRTSWFRTGYQQGDPAACDTFSQL
ncbi:MAG TPA: neutral zinc metallopeptidase [Trueperaceae bacterium]